MFRESHYNPSYSGYPIIYRDSAVDRNGKLRQRVLGSIFTDDINNSKFVEGDIVPEVSTLSVIL